MSHSSEIRVAVIGAGSWRITVAAPAGVSTQTTLPMSRSNESEPG
jgi:hypothetical protein